MVMASPHPLAARGSIVDILRTRAIDTPDRPAFTFLAEGEMPAGTLTYAALAARVQAIGDALRRHGPRRARAIMLFHPGLDLIAAFFGCLYADVIAVPLPPPTPAHKHRYLPRLLSVLQDAEAAIVLSTREMRAELQPLLASTPGGAGTIWIATDDVTDAMDSAAGRAIAGDVTAGGAIASDTIARDAIAGAAAGASAGARLTDDAWQPQVAAIDEVAYLQYTSGSTSAPKGVMITHANVINACDYNTRLFDWQPGTATVCWMPYFHDYGLIDGIVLPVFNGMHAYLMAPLAFVQRPIRWLDAISTYRATHSSGPNFAYDLCVRKTTAEDRARLDLRCWHSAANAAEPIRPRTVEQFIAMFEPHGLSRDSVHPGWGLAEATLVVSARRGARMYTVSAAALAHRRVAEPAGVATDLAAAPGSAADPATRADARTLVGCGHTLEGLHGTHAIIVNPETMARAAEDAVGEIWVAGDLVARGYWNKPDVTEAVFQAFTSDTGEGPFLRTGDLGFIRDGELVFAGRLKDLIILEGRNHYPQDIEITAEASHTALRPGCVVAFAIEGETSERVVLVAEMNSGADARAPLDVPAIVKAVRRDVGAEHGIRLHDVVLIRTGTITKTSSGKLQRAACRDRYLAGTLDRVDREPPAGADPARAAAETEAVRA